MYMTGLFYKYSYIYIYMWPQTRKPPLKMVPCKENKRLLLEPLKQLHSVEADSMTRKLGSLMVMAGQPNPAVSHLPPLEIFGLNSRPYGNQWVFIVFISPDHKALVSMGFSHLWLPNSPNITGNLGTWQMMNKRSTRTQNVLKEPPKTWRFNLTTIGNGLGILGDSSLNSQVT